MCIRDRSTVYYRSHLVGMRSVTMQITTMVLSQEAACVRRLVGALMACLCVVTKKFTGTTCAKLWHGESRTNQTQQQILIVNMIRASGQCTHDKTKNSFKALITVLSHRPFSCLQLPARAVQLLHPPVVGHYLAVSTARVHKNWLVWRPIASQQ